MRRLIINADDFGMSREVNEGIKQGIEAGIITSVSVIVNMPYFDDAISYLKKHPEVSVGLHFNITEGSPILDRKSTSTLILEDGSFFYWTSIVYYLFLRQISLGEISAELIVQYRKLEKTKLKISHIDSHHHLHLFPEIFRLLTGFAQKKGIKSLRCRAFNPGRLFFWLKNLPTFKQFIIITLCVIDSAFLAKSKSFYEVNNLFDISWDKKMTEEKFCHYLELLPDGTTEIICHPAVLSKTGNPRFLGPRYKGLKILLSDRVKKTIEKNNINLVGHI